MAKSIKDLKKTYFILSIIFLFLFTNICHSQSSPSSNNFFIRGNLNINNNGIDWVPFFSRDKPSLIANFSIGGERLSVSPLIRYELDGFQPWGFDIWWNYKIKKSGKFNFSLGGVFPGVVNQKISVRNYDLPTSILQPWVSAIIKPSVSYLFGKNFGINLSYFEIIPLKIVNTNQLESGRVIILSPMIKPLTIKNKIYIRWEPLLYSVQIEDTRTGLFSAQTLNLGIVNFPFSISSVMNKPIDFGGLSGKKFDWNIGINYSFELNLIKNTF
ncbi:MAG: hypothetical protein CMC63_04095 [Flavobacteriaceae bacterium]|nr:hypothetical protein [Flavobacteriaceae bacterium]